MSGKRGCVFAVLTIIILSTHGLSPMAESHHGVGVPAVSLTQTQSSNGDTDCSGKAADFCGPNAKCLDGKCFCGPGYSHQKNSDGDEVCMENPSSLGTVSSFCGLALLLFLGKVARVFIRPLQVLYLPSSVIGGLMGLIITSLGRLNDTWYEYYLREWIDGWSEYPAFLINIVFASLFLGTEIPPVKTVWVQAGPQLMYGMFVSWGQYVCAIFITAVFLGPVFAVNDLFPLIVPIGFAGGHGTAAGLKNSFETLGWSEGADFSLASATIGLLASVLIGMLLVNLAARRGWVKESGMKAANSKLSMKGIHPVESRPIAGVQTVSADSIDSLAWHFAIIGLAMLIGYALKQGLLAIESSSDSLADLGFFSGFPLFPLCMMGGIIIQKWLQKYNTSTPLIDSNLMDRLAGTALDFLVVSALSTVSLDSVAGDIVPFLIITVWGLLWQILCCLVLSRWLNPTHWFENAICVFGQSVGVIASALLLLRMVDPEAKTPVPQAFGYKQLIHSIFMGGGIWTSLSLPLTHVIGLWPMLGITGAVLLGWFSLYFFYFRKLYPDIRRQVEAQERQSEALLNEQRNSADFTWSRQSSFQDMSMGP